MLYIIQIELFGCFKHIMAQNTHIMKLPWTLDAS